MLENTNSPLGSPRIGELTKQTMYKGYDQNGHRNLYTIHEQEEIDGLCITQLEDQNTSRLLSLCNGELSPRTIFILSARAWKKNYTSNRESHRNNTLMSASEDGSITVQKFE